jgi:tetratricopeptide (TPR) repeat protein
MDRVAIPSTIQDVIMARVDSLPEEAKEVLQAGSAIEREFSYELIKTVTDLPDQDLLSQLSLLKDAELLYERGIFPQSMYIFRHALTREVVYASILTSRKKTLHERTGNAIERLSEKTIEANYRLLVEHYLAAENYEKGAEYSRLARKQSMKTGSANEAIAYAKKTVECLENLPQAEESHDRIVGARAILGFHYSQINRHVEAKEAIDPIAESALDSRSPRRRSQILSILGSHSYLVEENFPKAIEWLRDAERLAEQAKDYASVNQAEFWLGLGLSLNCDFEKGLSCLQRTFQVCMNVKSMWGASITKSNIGCFGYYFQGKIQPALSNSREALRIAEESLDIYPRSIAYACYGIACYGSGEFDLAKEHLVTGINLAEKINYPFWIAANNHFLGDICFENRTFSEADSHYANATRAMRENRTMPSWVNLSTTASAKAKVMQNDKRFDFNSLAGYAAQCRLRILEGWTRRNLGEIFLNIDDQHFPEAQHWIEQAIEADERNGMRWHMARDVAVHAELFKRKGNKEKAKEQLGKAIDIYKECGADGWVTKAEEGLAKIS